MKLIVAGLVASMLFAWSSPALALECFTNRRIVAVNTGWVAAEGRIGPDGGDAVVISLDNGRLYPMNQYYNLDHPRGQALHRVALMALVQRLTVTGHDHFGYNCEAIDEISVKY